MLAVCDTFFLACKEKESKMSTYNCPFSVSLDVFSISIPSMQNADPANCPHPGKPYCFASSTDYGMGPNAMIYLSTDQLNADAVRAQMNAPGDFSLISQGTNTCILQTDDQTLT
jgi:hypothetical protein